MIDDNDESIVAQFFPEGPHHLEIDVVLAHPCARALADGPSHLEEQPYSATGALQHLIHHDVGNPAPDVVDDVHELKWLRLVVDVDVHVLLQLLDILPHELVYALGRLRRLRLWYAAICSAARHLCRLWLWDDVVVELGKSRCLAPPPAGRLHAEAPP